MELVIKDFFSVQIEHAYASLKSHESVYSMYYIMFICTLQTLKF